MKKILHPVFLLCSLFTFGQFPVNPVQWPTPGGGNDYEHLGSSFTGGFDYVANEATLTGNYGQQSWSLMDMDGDGKPDLVVTSVVDSNGYTYGARIQFGAASNPYWMVYLNNGNGFSSTPIHWSTPGGGNNYEHLGTTFTGGFDYVANEATPNGNYGQQSWSLMDMDGDGKPDLVVTSVVDSNGYTYGARIQYGASSGAYWKVYLNNGNGFSATPVNWTTPQGGNNYEHLGSTFTGGFDYVANEATPTGNYGQQSWSLMDMDGDGKPDLVVTSVVDSNGYTYGARIQYGVSSGAYWKVYLNNGNGFSATPVNWTTPQGGNNYEHLGSTFTGGFDYVANEATPNGNYGQQSWSLMDIDGDGKPDLVVTSVVDSNGYTYGARIQYGVSSGAYWKVYLNNGNGFSATPVNWITPPGGNNYEHLGSTFTGGYDYVANEATPNGNYGQQSWSVTDMNGDGKPDLVVTSVVDSNGYTYGARIQFGAASNPYWMVYLNNGNGFSASPVNWTTPQGGNNYEHLGSTFTGGFDYVANEATPNGNYGRQSWSVTDMNGDGKPDMVVTSVVDSNGYAYGASIQFDATTNPFWNVYINSNTTAISKVTNVSPHCILYPNPNNGNFTLQFTDAGERSIEVYDMTGRIIKLPVTMQNPQQFNLGAVSAGIYLLRITQNDEVSNVKFMVE